MEVRMRIAAAAIATMMSRATSAAMAMNQPQDIPPPSSSSSVDESVLLAGSLCGVGSTCDTGGEMGGGVSMRAIEDLARVWLMIE